MNEFEIIQQFFNHQTVKRTDVVLGIGDDCAIVNVREQQLVITTDTLIEEVHFLKNTPAYDLGFKTLAVNLSDLAAMGADPAWITLALTLPNANETWLNEFSHGLIELATRYGIQLIGGDLTKGHLSITIGAYGFIPPSKALRRDGAIPEDLIYVTHTLGDAALALLFLKKKIAVADSHTSTILKRYMRPEPRIEIGKELREMAHAAIDISDGLAADLGHLLEKSKVGAMIYVDQLPLSQALRASVPALKAIELALNGGDDYELCFTVPSDKEYQFTFDCTCIGKITEKKGLDLQYSDGKKYPYTTQGYQHFS